MARRNENQILYETFTSFLNNCLFCDKSLLWPDKDYWTLDNLLALKRHVIDVPDFGKDLSFEEKLEKQLADAAPSEWALVCDIYFVYFMPSVNMTLEKIRNDIEWAASKAGITAPSASNPIWNAQSSGFVRTAVRYHVKYSQFWLIILFAIYVKEHEDKQSIIQKHEVMRQAMDMILENIEVRRDRASDMRHAILYMAYPDQYERIISTGAKKRIVNTYQHLLQGDASTDLDDRLLLIRKELTNNYDKPDRKFDFYTDLRDEWDPKPAAPIKVTKVDTDKGTIIVPEYEIDTDTLADLAKDHTIHTEIQWLLLKLGNDMGLDLWVAKNDRGKEINGRRLMDFPRLKKSLPLTFDEVTNKTIQLIDVLWLKKKNILAAFEIESTTSIYSGILRMADLIAMQPNINIPLYIVAPDERRAKVYSEVNRPVFSNMSTPMNELCKYISFSALRESIKQAGQMVKHLNPEFLDDIAETCDVDDNE